MNRRRFLEVSAAAGPLVLRAAVEKPKLLGGKPVRTERFPSWPKFDEREDRALLGALRSGKWFRGNGENVGRFEAAYAQLTGAKYCLATANGTSALLTSLSALGVGPGHEVLLPPQTFVACVNVILMLQAVPVFVDIDPATFQIDARKMEALITERTGALMPVHLGGAVADLDAILPIARKHKVPVVEDTCQSHLAEWRNRKAGTYGDTGCFSFQASKNLTSGEGGAVLTNSQELVEKCYAFHNNGRSRKTSSYDFSYGMRGLNLRMTEFQAALLMAQMTRIEAFAKTREQNAQYLTSLLREIPGIVPARVYDGCTRNAWHLYMFRYKKEQFANLPRAKFLKAMSAEGIPTSAGYGPLNKEPFVKNALGARGFRAVYSKEEIDRWESRNHCPQNDQLCEESVWFTQNMLLAERRDMEQIAEAVRKIHTFAGDLAR